MAKETKVNKNGIVKQIALDELNNYLSNGWHLGSGKVAWNKGLTKKDPRVKKYSEAQKGRHLTEDQKKHLSKLNKGKKWSEEALIKRSKSRKGFKPSKSQRQKTSLKLKGHVVSKETRMKISIKNKGKSHPQSLEAKQKISLHNSSIEFQNHQRKIKSINNSFNSSKPEKLSQLKLKEKFGDDVYFHYSELRYPFECDAYIKSLDLFIEFNYHWTHGKHPFNENNKFDIEELVRLKSKPQIRINSKGKECKSFYKVAIEVWTIRDVAKIKCANENRLNYILFYSYNEFLTWLDSCGV